MRRTVTRFVAVIGISVCSAGSPDVRAQAPPPESAVAIQSQLGRIPRVWEEGPVHRLTRREYEATLDFWSERHGDRLAVERVGESVEKMGIFLLRISDSTVADDDKQIALITALHGGPERSGTTTTMALVEWLLGDSPEAAEIRRRQIVLLMPVANPYAYFVTDRFGNSLKIDPYTGGGTQAWDFESQTFKNIARAPEIAAFLAVVDRYRPEVHLDLHGTGLQEYPESKLGERERYRGQIMTEITGSAYSNSSLRPWDWRVTEAMIAAGNAAGYPSDRFEADAQQLLFGPGMDAAAGQFWRGRARYYTAQYAYTRYHTMIGALEIGWEASGVARARGLLRIGNEKWENERHTGYPVDRVKGYIGHYLTAWGTNARERRASRVELWQKQARMSQGVLYPQSAGRDTYLVGLTEAGTALLDGDREEVLQRLDTEPAFDAAAIRAFFKNGPEIKLSMEKGDGRGARREGRIEGGVGIRLRVPYRKAEIVEIRVNGHLLEERGDGGKGYQTWIGNGFLQVQIDLPPEEAAALDAVIVTCGYVPHETREYGWQPPAEVLARLKKALPDSDKSGTDQPR